jgi:hypothetical protein
MVREKVNNKALISWTLPDKPLSSFFPRWSSSPRSWSGQPYAPDKGIWDHFDAYLLFLTDRAFALFDAGQ